MSKKNNQIIEDVEITNEEVFISELKVQNLGVRYDDTKSVLNDINLTIKGGR